MCIMSAPHALTNEEQRSAAKLIKRISPEKRCISTPSGGSYTYYRFMHHAGGDGSLSEKLGNRHINYYVLHNL